MDALIHGISIQLLEVAIILNLLPPVHILERSKGPGTPKKMVEKRPRDRMDASPYLADPSSILRQSKDNQARWRQKIIVTGSAYRFALSIANRIVCERMPVSSVGKISPKGGIERVVLSVRLHT
jgi:hypothetical protein